MLETLPTFNQETIPSVANSKHLQTGETSSSALAIFLYILILRIIQLMGQFRIMFLYLLAQSELSHWVLLGGTDLETRRKKKKW